MKENLYEPYSVSVQTMSEYPGNARNPAFFELAYVLNGEGQRKIDHQKYSYRAGDMFLLTSREKHDFRIVGTTEFFFLRFNDVYHAASGIVKENIQRLEFLLHNARQTPASVLRNETDKPLVKMIVESIMREHINRSNGWQTLSLALVNTLIVITSRNIEKHLPAQAADNQAEKTLDIIRYIQANIYHPDRIRAEQISQELDISLAYLGRYFKKHTGQTMQDYISAYRTKLIENRLQYSTMRLTEIAGELGFADESHLNKFFRKHKGTNPSEYRKTTQHEKRLSKQ